MRVLMLAALVTLVAFAGCVDDDGPADGSSEETLTPVGKETWVFDAYGTQLDASAFPYDLPSFEQVHVTQRVSGEPTIGVTRTGAVFYPSIDFDGGQVPVDNPELTVFPSSVLFRTRDHGATWEDASPHIVQQNTHLYTFDPYVYVDPTTGRVYNMDMGPHVACNKVSWSDNDGKTWVTREGACPLPGADHPTLFTGPKVGPAGSLAPVTDVATGYPNNVYLCSNQIADTQCSLSPDGGLTWLPSQPVFFGVNSDTLVSDTGSLDWLCSSMTGHGHASWVDGTVYIPRLDCGRPWLAISRDGGLSYETVTVAEGEEYTPQEGIHDAYVHTDVNGTVYYFWIGGAGSRAYLTVSHDQGSTWSEPWDVTAPGVTAMQYPSIVAGDQGKVAFLYVGTTSPSGWGLSDYEAGNETLRGEYLNATWNAYVTVGVDVHTDDPVFAATTINDLDKPLKRGNCYDRCKGDEGGMYDFLDLDMDPMTGQLWAAIVDVCTQECDEPGATSETVQRSWGTVGKQTGGLFLLTEPIPESVYEPIAEI